MPTKKGKATRTAKQIAASTKNILAYEQRDDMENFTKGFLTAAIPLGLVIVSLLVMYA